MRSNRLFLTPPKGPLARMVWDRDRFKVVVSGRRLGKTGQALRWLVLKAAACPRKSWENWYIAPYYKDAREIAWKRLHEIIPEKMIKKSHESRLEITLKNGNSIALKGGDRPDSLVGRAVFSAVFDEYGGMKKEVWDFLRPGFSDTGGEAVFIGTPRGANHFRDMYMDALSGRLPDFKAYPIFRTVDSPFVPSEEVERARMQMDPRMFRQEYEGSFESWAGLIFDNFDLGGNVGNISFEKGLPVYVGMDFGWVDPTVALWMQYIPSVDIWHILDEFIRPFTPPDMVADMIKGKEVTFREGSFKAPMPLSEIDRILTGGEINIRRQEGGGRSMKNLLAARGIPKGIFRIHSPRVFDSIQNVRSRILTADGQRKLIVHPRCTTVIRDFQSWHYPEKGGEITGERPEDSPENHRFSHTMDAIRYVIEGITPVKKRGEWLGIMEKKRR